MDERTKEIEKLMRRWLYIGAGALFFFIITIILFYYDRNWIQLVLILAQLTLIYISIKGYVDLKKAK
mgnify:CR=1 FL=1